MAHFITRIQGNRGGASRLGTKTSGVTASVNGWDIGATCSVSYNESKGRDEVSVTITRGSGHGNPKGHIGTFYLNEKTGKTVKIKG